MTDEVTPEERTPTPISADATGVRRRKVFFLHGYDGRGPRQWYWSFRHNAAAYTERYDAGLTVKRQGSTNWHAQAPAVTCEFRYLMWCDLVREDFRSPIWRLYLASLRDLTDFASTGWIGRVFAAGRMVWGWSIYPFVAALVYVLVAALVAWAAMMGALAISPWAVLPVGVLMAWAVFRITLLIEPHQYVYYLMRTMHFIRMEARGRNPALEERRAGFAQEIVQAVNSGTYDEVLIVGHSQGACQAVHVVELALPLLSPGARLSLLTLGQSIPLVAFHPSAENMRAAVDLVASAPQVDWFDVSSKTDTLCFATPAAQNARRRAIWPGKAPETLSARLGRIYSRKTLRKLRFRIFDMHFVYFLANDKPGRWDWMAVCCGDRRLAERLGPAGAAGK